MKKIYAAMICMVMALFLTFSVQAQDEGTRLEVAKVTAEPGTKVEVPLIISENTGLCGATLSVSYDANLSLEDVKEGTALPGLTMTKPGDMSANPIRVLWFGVDPDASNGEICTLVFTAPQEAGTYAIVLTYEPDDVVDGNLDPVELSVTNGGIVIEDARGDQEIAEDFIASVDALDPSDRKAVEKLRLAYNNLTQEQKALVPEETLKKLTDAEEVFQKEDEKKLEDQQAALATEDAIKNIDPEDETSVQKAREAFDALSPQQQALISPQVLEILENAEKALEDAKADRAAAQAVATQINALGNLEELTAADEARIAAARDAFDALTNAQKALIDTEVLLALEAAEQRVEALVSEVWSDWTVQTAPTCEEAGTEIRTNLADPTLQEEREVAPLGHKWDEGSVTTEPACETAGVRTYVCEHDSSHTRREEIPALGHTLTYRKQVTADCETPGNYTYWHCEQCEKDFADEDGIEEFPQEQIVIPALGHRLDSIAFVEPDCENEGHIAYYHCRICGKNFLNSDGTGELSDEDIRLEAYGHFWDYAHSVITREPTETEDGEKTYTCTVCGQTKTEPIPYDDIVIRSDAWAGNEFLEEFTFTSDIRKIEDGAFAGCSGLKELYFEGDMPVFGKDVFLDIAPDAVLYYPKDNPTWSEEALEAAGVKVQSALWDPDTQEVIQAEIADAVVTIKEASLVYDGTQKTPGVVVKYEDRVLEENRDYTLIYGENTNAGVGSVTVVGKVNYTGSREETFRIAKAEGKLVLAENTRTVKIDDGGFDVTVTELISDGVVSYTSSDATVAVVDSANGHVTPLRAGTTLITATAAGTNYTTASAVLTLTITGNSGDGSAAQKKENTIQAADKTIKGTGKAQSISIGASAGGGAPLTYQSDQAGVKVAANGTMKIAAKFAGKATITIASSETAEYLPAVKKISVIVRPKAMSLSKVKSTGAKKAQATWKKNATAQGYQLQYALNKKFTKSKKTVTIKKVKTVKKVVKKLKPGKKYFFRIRAYVTVDGKKYYSDWSKAKTVKIRK